MNILVLYGTSEGQTRKVAEYAAECLRGHGHDVVLADAAVNLNRLDPSAFEAAMLASRVHAGRHHRAIIAFARSHPQQLAAIDTAFVSVSMSAAHKRGRDSGRLSLYRSEFIKATGWEPDCYHDVAGARLYTRHNRLTRWVLGLVDRQQYDTSKDHEFTDWLDLRTFVNDWAGRLDLRRLLSATRLHTARGQTGGPDILERASQSAPTIPDGALDDGQAIIHLVDARSSPGGAFGDVTL